MDLKSIRLIREEYLELLAQNPEYNNILTELSEKPETNPLSSIVEVEPESDLSYNTEQRQLSEILLDMYSINNALSEVKNNVVDIIDSLDESLNTLRLSVDQQMEQVNDLNILCGQNSVFNAIVPIYVSDFGDTDAEMLDAKTIGAAIIKSDQISYDIVSISGNGYSGNGFVYRDGSFESDTDDRSDLRYIMDDNDITIYEYSRLYANNKKDISMSYINYDNRAVECTITLSAKEAVCKAQILSPDKDLCIVRLETSEDGVRYVSRLRKPLYINDLSKIYNSSTYIYGSNTLCFPYSNFIRITLSNDKVTDDELRVQEEDKTVILNARRKKISIAGIRLYSSIYTEAVLESQEIIEDGNIDKISLFASEYVPDHFPGNNYISYSLIINGVEHPIVPVNSKKAGTKIIKYTEDIKSSREDVEILDETIKTIKVKVVISPYNNTESPYASNIKLCMGKNTGDLYV